MNRISVTQPFLTQLGNEGSEQLTKDLHSTVRRLADDPISNSVTVPFQGYGDIRMISVSGYAILFRFDPEKSQIYLLSILKTSENVDPAAKTPPRSL